MRVLSAAEMQACDRATTERFQIPSVDLMRHAASSIALCVHQLFPHATHVTVLCGRGNNGGDGMMAARLLAESGIAVTLLLLGSPSDLKGDAATAWSELTHAALCTVHIVESAEDLTTHNAALDTDLILDAIVGTGFKPPLKGLALSVLDWLTASLARKSVPILAVDLPSGWPADETSATVKDPVFPADAVVTFTAPKPAHVFGQLTRTWDQPVVVAPIGSPDDAIVSDLNIEWAGSAQQLTLAPRAADANKGKYGHVLIVGGSFGSAGGKAGAPAMASLAAMRVGAGLVTAAVPAPALPVVSGHAPELMTWPLKANSQGQATPENLTPENIEAVTKGITVLALGPGLGQSDDTAKFCLGLLEATSMSAVVDADALNILATQPGVFARLTAKGRTIVITPHPGEMARLAGIPTAEVQSKRLDVARHFAQRTGAIVVLKGARTLIAHPSGRVAVNTTGNPGMAKGGSGDLLTGMVAGLLAQHPQQHELAVEAAVFLHGLAADIAVRSGNEHTLLATDSLPHLSQAFRFRSRTGNGYVWLQGLPGDSLPVKCSREAAE
ncbi:MAG TPA: NAD(P)H-hydrate dehydratase [Terracidiphilus sp.]|jgi:NAD(P)H-hydrate epimerase